MKKLVTNTETLRPALKKIALAINDKSTLPILSNIYLKARTNEVELIATDLELTISYVLDCECKDEFELLVPFKFLAKLTSLLGNQPVELQYNGKTKATIIAEGEAYRFGSLEKIEEYPKLPDIPKRNTMDLDGDFMEWLGRAMATVSKDELRPAMTHALLEMSKEGVTIVSTNAHCLFKRFFSLTYAGEPEDILIPPKMAKALHGTEKATLSWRQNHIAMTSGKITLICTRLDSKFPDYRVVIPNSQPTLKLCRQDLLGALCKSSLFNDKQIGLRLNPANQKKFILFAVDVDLERDSEITVPGAFTGKETEIAFAPALFETILDQIPFDEIRLHVDGPKRGVVITSEEETNYLGMIMPLLLNNQ